MRSPLPSEYTGLYGGWIARRRRDRTSTSIRPGAPGPITAIDLETVASRRLAEITSRAARTRFGEDGDDVRLRPGKPFR